MRAVGYSFGFSASSFNQIIVFTNEEEFKEIVAANPNMTAIMGMDDHTKKNFPGVFLAGVKANSQKDRLGDHPLATRTQDE